MNDKTEVLYAGTSIFIDFPLQDNTIPVTMTCLARLINKDGVELISQNVNTDVERTKFELRIPYTETTGLVGSLTTLIVQVTDTDTGYSDVIYDRQLSWK